MQGIRTVLARRAALALAMTTVGVMGSSAVASATTFTVNDQSDAPLASAGDTNCASTDAGACTLRAAVQAADNTGGANTISLPAGTYTMTQPATSSNDPSNGDLDVNNNGNNTSITLTGAGSDTTVIDANQVDRAFAVQPGGGLTLSGVTIKNGNPASASTGSQDGGAIYSDGALVASGDVVFLGNSAYNGSYGGAIYADSDTGSSVSLNGTTFDHNGAYYGAGVYDNSPNLMSVASSAFVGGATDEDYGGGIYGAGSGGLTVDGTTFSRNSVYQGGAIYWTASTAVSVTNSSFNNNASYDGGAIYDNRSSAMTLTGDRFIGNSGNYGGALYLDGGSTSQTTLNQDEFDTNSAIYEGGAVYRNSGPLSADGSSFVNNNGSEDGGALYANSSSLLSLVNTTMDGNSSYDGGGIYVATTMPAVLINDTIARNSAAATAGGGVYGPASLQLPDGGGGIRNTIIANNSGGDCGNFGPQTFTVAFDQGNNLDSDSSCFGGLGASGDKTGVNPLIGRAADNGGPVLTDAELPGSPAVDAGTNTGCPATDARGVSRPQGASCDIGAFEAAAANLSLTNTGPSNSNSGAPFSYTLTVSNGGPGFSTGTTVTDQLPAGETLYGATASQGSCTSSGSPAKVSCALGNLASGGSTTVSLVVSEANVGSVTNTATAGNDQGSSVSASATTTVASSQAASSNAPPAASGSAPRAISGPALNVTSGSATLTGSVVTGGPSTAYFFQYGKSTGYGLSSGVNSLDTSGDVSASLRNLGNGATYHYRLVAINSNGTAYGADKTFRTAGHRFEGQLLLDGLKLHVRRSSVDAKFTCQSSTACLFRFSIVIRARVAHTKKFATLLFTESRTSLKRIAAHGTVTESARVNPAALAVLQSSPHQRMSGKLSTRPRSNQVGIIDIVSLQRG